MNKKLIAPCLALSLLVTSCGGLNSKTIADKVAKVEGMEIPKRKTLEANKKPNILYIMADDMTAEAISAYKGRYAGVFSTPNIDRIANEGSIFNNTYCSNAICVPSRATIVTGQYSNKNGVKTLNDHLDKSKNTYVKMAHDAGYTTSLIGKWHLGTEPQGFDYYSILQGQGKYFDTGMIEKSDKLVWPDPALFKDANKYAKPNVQVKGHTTDYITQDSLKWLQGRDKSKPFLMMIHHKAPHGPVDEFQPKYANLLKDVDLPVPESFYEDKSHRNIASRYFGPLMYNIQTDTYSEADKKKAYDQYQTGVKNYLRLIKGVDESVGEILNYLDKNGLTENTVVIFTSDQGRFTGEHNYADKRMVFEDSMRMPLMIRYPGEIPANSKCESLITNVDYAPTILDYAGLAKSPEMQGRSFRDNIIGKTPADWQKSVYFRYWMHGDASSPAHYALRTEDYKLILYYGMALDSNTSVPKDAYTPIGWELYDLKKDPLEIHNVYDDPKYADVIKDLKKQLAAKKSEIGDDDKAYPELLKRVKDFEEGRPDSLAKEKELILKNSQWPKKK